MSNKTSWFIILLIFIVVSCGKKNGSNEYTGILEGISVKVPAMTGGKIVKMQVREGESIQQGQLIAMIDTMELVFNKEQLEAGLEDLNVQTEITKTNLSRLKKDCNYVKEKHQRISKLYQNNSISKQELDNQTNKLESAESALMAAKQSLQSIGAKHKQLKAQLKTVQKKIRDAVIIAPVPGIITSKYYETGEAIMPMSPVVEIINIKKMETKIYISERQLPSIKHGQDVKIRVDGLDKEFSGKIEWISPKAQFTPKTILTPETRTSLVYAVKIMIENPDDILKHGMPVVVKL